MIESSFWLRWTIEMWWDCNPLYSSHLIHHTKYWFCIIVTSKLKLSFSSYSRTYTRHLGVQTFLYRWLSTIVTFVFVRREQASTRKGAARKVEGGGNRNIRLMADVLHFRCHIISWHGFRRKLNSSSGIVSVEQIENCL